MMEMEDFIGIVWEAVCRGELLFMGNNVSGRRWIEPPSGGTVLALAPHPDDPDAVAVTLRVFHAAGCRIRYAVTGSAHGGVTDEYARAKAGGKGIKPKKLKDRKVALRREEQAASATAARIVDGEVVFLDSGAEDDLGDLSECPDNTTLVRGLLVDENPDIVLLPYGEDTNAGHVALFNMFREAAPLVAVERGRRMMALYVHDPKTTSIDENLVVPFDGEGARWKAGLLRCHDSQQQRNIQQRGYGLDERILKLNRRIQKDFQSRVLEPWPEECIYAESFQIELFG